MVEKLASAIYNDIVGGLVGITATPNLSIEQLQDDVVDEWLQIIKEYSLKNLIPVKDLIMAINCVDVDCEALDKCPVCKPTNPSSEKIQHFQIPQIINDFGDEAIDYIGSTDKTTPYIVYTDTRAQYHQFKRRGSEKPYVFILTVPNENNMYDGWLFNAPFVKTITIIAIFKDPRQLKSFGCCEGEDLENYTFISAEIKKRLTEKKLRYYRQLYPGPTPNNQVPH